MSFKKSYLVVLFLLFSSKMRLYQIKTIIREVYNFSFVSYIILTLESDRFSIEKQIYLLDKVNSKIGKFDNYSAELIQ